MRSVQYGEIEWADREAVNGHVLGVRSFGGSLEVVCSCAGFLHIYQVRRLDDLEDEAWLALVRAFARHAWSKTA